MIAALAAVDLPPEVAKARPGELSGGQRQRVVLARATMIPPAVLLCDEPTSALDASLAKSVLALIRDLRARIGMTVLFVTHDLAVARLMGDRIAVMQAGRVVELGSCRAGDRRTPRARTPARCSPRCPRSSREPSHDRQSWCPADGCGRCRSVGRVWRRPMAWALVGLLALVTLVAVFARQLAPYNPIQPVGPLNLPPLSPGHLLGTDGIGRDLLSRTLIGIQVSWLSALVVVASGLLIGGTIGLIAGATGGWIDSVLLMRVTDLFLALPGALVAIAIVAALGSGLVNTLIGVALVWWPYYARIVRGETKALAARPHVEAARLAGVGRPRILTRHLLPGVVPDGGRHRQPGRRQRGAAAGRAVVPRAGSAGAGPRARRRHRPRVEPAAQSVVGARHPGHRGAAAEPDRQRRRRRHPQPHPGPEVSRCWAF